MITALVFTIVLNGAETQVGYNYPNELACNSAIPRVMHAGTGPQRIKNVECRPVESSGPGVRPSSEWQAIGVALRVNTVQLMDEPMNVGSYPDGTSCKALLNRMTYKNANMSDMDLITLCVPKAG